ncbi:hypothetical protein BH10PSE7_BH10PSE7_22500 [soil metagenome]
MATSDISPGPIVDAILGYQKTAAIKAAIALGLFTEIAAGTATAPALAAKTNTAERGIRILSDFLTVNGFLTKHGDRYALTPATAAFLDKRSPAYMGSVADFLSSPEMTNLFLDDPLSYIRNGGSVGLANMAADNPIWVKFAEAMVPFVGVSSKGLGEAVAALPKPPQKVLDIAAGPGLFGIAAAKAAPSAEIVAVDWQIVLELTKRHAGEAGVGARYRTITGSAFDVDWGTGYDLVLLPNFLHHFDHDTCVALLKKILASLNADGRVMVVEFMPNEDRVSPPFPAAFAFMMIGTTQKGDAYTERELAAMARDAGFAKVSAKPLPPSSSTLITFER